MVTGIFVIFESLSVFFSYIIKKYEKKTLEALAEQKNNDIYERIRIHEYKIWISFISLVAVLCVGTLVLIFLEKWTFIESLYFVIQTVSVSIIYSLSINVI